MNIIYYTNVLRYEPSSVIIFLYKKFIFIKKNNLYIKNEFLILKNDDFWTP